MATASTTIKLQTNIPLVGLLKYCDYAVSKNEKYGDQICVKGEFDGYGENGQSAGSGRVYLPLTMEGKLQSIGVIGPKSAAGNYPFLVGSPRVRFLKTEIDGNKTLITPELLGSSQAPARSAPPASAPSSRGPGPAPQSPQDGMSNANKKLHWESLVLTMEACLKESIALWERAAPMVKPDADGIASTAHTLFIQSVRDGVLRTPKAAFRTGEPAAPPPPPPPPPTPMATVAQLTDIASICAQLKADEAWLTSELDRVGVRHAKDLTEAAATKFIQLLATYQPAAGQEEDIPF